MTVSFFVVVFVVFSLFWQVNPLEKVPERSGRPVRADGGDRG
jgi:hypothetical protein